MVGLGSRDKGEHIRKIWGQVGNPKHESV
jgi:hypothetical protein